MGLRSPPPTTAHPPPEKANSDWSTLPLWEQDWLSVGNKLKMTVNTYRLVYFFLFIRPDSGVWLLFWEYKNTSMWLKTALKQHWKPLRWWKMWKKEELFALFLRLVCLLPDLKYRIQLLLHIYSVKFRFQNKHLDSQSVKRSSVCRKWHRLRFVFFQLRTLFKISFVSECRHV